MCTCPKQAASSPGLRWAKIWNSSQRCRTPSVLSSFKLRHTAMCANSPCSQCCGVLPIFFLHSPWTSNPRSTVCRMAVREPQGSSMWEWKTNALLPCLQWWDGFYFKCPQQPHNWLPPSPALLSTPHPASPPIHLLTILVSG